MKNVFFAFVILFSFDIALAQQRMIAGFNLTENGDHLIYDASADPQNMTEAQKVVRRAKSLGANHIILNVRALMNGGTSNEITPVTPPSERQKEAQRMTRLIRDIQSLGMTVGIRPIFFVVGPNNEFPYFEVQSDGTRKLWWHGNIQPSNPNRWFESFRIYLDQYILIARVAKADEFTLGAELYSMTVGIEDQWKENPYGFPGRWLELLRYVRSKLPQARLMYDINFTDDSVNAGSLTKAGGEMERWRYRLVDLAQSDTTTPEGKIWQDLVDFWKGLDAIGIDMYRSLADHDQLNFPLDLGGLTSVLKVRSDSYASQMDTILAEIAVMLDHEKVAIFKEVGFRSVERGFIDPFAYAGPGTYNELHQAAAYNALLQSFWAAKWPWFGGVNFWDIPVNPLLHGVDDTGFSPLGKPMTEEVIKQFYPLAN